MATTHQKFTNNASTTKTGAGVAGDVLAIGGTSLTLTAGHGARFPALAAGEYSYLTLYEVIGGVESNIEIVKCTAVAGDVLTIVRNIESTGAYAYPTTAGSTPAWTFYVQLRYTAFAAGNNLTKDGNLESLDSVSTARTNLGLGTIATQAASAVAVTGGTIEGVAIKDSNSFIVDNTDATKKIAFEASGITTGTTRTVTVPDKDVTLPGVNTTNTWASAQTFSSTLNKVTITAPATSATLTIADGKTLTASNTLTLAGTDATVMTFPSTSATIARTDASNTFTGAQTIHGVTSTGATGTGNFVFSTSPTLVTPTLGAASATSLALGTPLPVTSGGTGLATLTTAYGLLAAGTTATGTPQTLATGATTDLLVGGGASAVPVWTAATGTGAPVRATSPTLVTPILGTPTSGTLTSCTGLPISTGVSGLASGAATFLGTATSANLAALVSDETGSGALVFATSPSLTTPTINTAASVGGTWTAAATWTLPSFTLASTTSSSTGIVTKGGARWLHDFALAGTDGSNLFLGFTSGNFTMLGSSTYMGSSLVGIGNYSLTGNTTGYSNVGVGNYTLYANTSGNSNVAVGQSAMASNTTGSLNTAVGRNALSLQTTGANNTAVGYDAGGRLTTASDNTHVGYRAGYNGTTGAQNTSVGSGALFSSTTGTQNVAVGYQAAYNVTTGFGGVAIGHLAMPLATTAAYCVAIGPSALGALTTGTSNLAIGYSALSALNTGTYNIAIGRGAATSVTTATSNVIVGVVAGNAVTTGGTNVIAGYNAGATLTTGSDNTLIGNAANVTSAAQSNATALGNGATATANNQVMLGNGSVTEVKTAGSMVAGTFAKVGSYTVAGVPSAVTAGAGAIIFVSNEAGGAVLAFSDATDWRRVTDRAVIS